MLDHLIINATDIETSRKFYEAALAPLGYEIVMEFSGGVGLGIAGKPDFWVSSRKPVHSGVHVAFHGADRAAVDAFHAAALAAGGKDNGAPGLREVYHPNYYGAFALDPDGNNIEVVCHDPEA